MTMTRVYENQVIRDVTLAHRVKSIHSAQYSRFVLECDCGRKFYSSAPADGATRRLWKTHAIHVSVKLTELGDDQ